MEICDDAVSMVTDTTRDSDDFNLELSSNQVLGLEMLDGRKVNPVGEQDVEMSPVFPVFSLSAWCSQTVSSNKTCSGPMDDEDSDHGSVMSESLLQNFKPRCSQSNQPTPTKHTQDDQASQLLFDDTQSSGILTPAVQIPESSSQNFGSDFDIPPLKRSSSAVSTTQGSSLSVGVASGGPRHAMETVRVDSYADNKTSSQDILTGDVDRPKSGAQSSGPDDISKGGVGSQITEAGDLANVGKQRSEVVANNGAKSGSGNLDNGAKSGSGNLDNGPKFGSGNLDNGAKSGSGNLDNGAKSGSGNLDDGANIGTPSSGVGWSGRTLSSGLSNLSGGKTNSNKTPSKAGNAESKGGSQNLDDGAKIGTPGSWAGGSVRTRNSGLSKLSGITQASQNIETIANQGPSKACHAESTGSTTEAYLGQSPSKLLRCNGTSDVITATDESKKLTPKSTSTRSSGSQDNTQNMTGSLTDTEDREERIFKKITKQQKYVDMQLRASNTAGCTDLPKVEQNMGTLQTLLKQLGDQHRAHRQRLSSTVTTATKTKAERNAQKSEVELLGKRQKQLIQVVRRQKSLSLKLKNLLNRKTNSQQQTQTKLLLQTPDNFYSQTRLMEKTSVNQEEDIVPFTTDRSVQEIQSSASSKSATEPLSQSLLTGCSIMRKGNKDKPTEMPDNRPKTAVITRRASTEDSNLDNVVQPPPEKHVYPQQRASQKSSGETYVTALESQETTENTQSTNDELHCPKALIQQSSIGSKPITVALPVALAQEGSTPLPAAVQRSTLITDTRPSAIPKSTPIPVTLRAAVQRSSLIPINKPATIQGPTPTPITRLADQGSRLIYVTCPVTITRSTAPASGPVQSSSLIPVIKPSAKPGSTPTPVTFRAAVQGATLIPISTVSQSSSQIPAAGQGSTQTVSRPVTVLVYKSTDVGPRTSAMCDIEATMVNSERNTQSFEGLNSVPLVGNSTEQGLPSCTAKNNNGILLRKESASANDTSCYHGKQKPSFIPPVKIRQPVQSVPFSSPPQRPMKIPIPLFKSPPLQMTTSVDNISPSTASCSDVFPVKTREINRRIQQRRRLAESQQLTIESENPIHEEPPHPSTQTDTTEQSEILNVSQVVSEKSSSDAPQMTKYKSLRALIDSGDLLPGKDCLVTESANGRYVGSLTDSGYIRASGGEIFKTPVQWVSAVNDGILVKKSRAYREVLYNRKPLVAYLKANPLSALNPTQRLDEATEKRSEGLVNTEQDIIPRTSTLDLASFLRTCSVRIISDSEIVPSDDLPENFWTEDFCNVRLTKQMWDQIDRW